MSDEFDKALLAKARTFETLTQFEEFDAQDDQDEAEFVTNGTFVELDFAGEFMPEFERIDEPSFFQVWVEEKTLERSDTLETLGDLPRYTRSGRSSGLRDYQLPDGRPGRLVVTQFFPQFHEEWGNPSEIRQRVFESRYPGAQRPLVTLAIAEPRDELIENIQFIRNVLASALLGLFLIFTLSIELFVRRALAPVKSLARRVKNFPTPDTTGQQISLEGLPEEIYPLGNAINISIQRLAQAAERERQFSRNIAHELRTPIAELKTISDVAGRWPEDTEAVRGYFSNVSLTVKRMEQMVSNLLLIASQESETLQTSGNKVDLTQEIDSAKGRFEAELAEGNNELELQLQESLTVKADPVHTEMILNNLFSNAIGHGETDGKISINLNTINENQFSLSIRNKNSVLQQQDMEKIFDRFWRKDKARANSYHSGLGLSLVKLLVELNGWDVEAVLDKNDYFTVTVTGAVVE